MGFRQEIVDQVTLETPGLGDEWVIEAVDIAGVSHLRLRRANIVSPRPMLDFDATSTITVDAERFLWVPDTALNALQADLAGVITLQKATPVDRWSALLYDARLNALRRLALVDVHTAAGGTAFASQSFAAEKIVNTLAVPSYPFAYTLVVEASQGENNVTATDDIRARIKVNGTVRGLKVFLGQKTAMTYDVKTPALAIPANTPVTIDVTLQNLTGGAAANFVQTFADATTNIINAMVYP